MSGVRFFTPDWILDLVRQVAPIGLDPCADPKSTVGARRSIMLPEMVALTEASPEDLEAFGVIVGDGLAERWRELLKPGESVFCNPPYGRGYNEAWAKKCNFEAESLRVEHLFALVPASVGAGWFEYYWRAPRVCFFNGRIRFKHAGNENQAGTFDSALAYFGKHPELFDAIFRPYGAVTRRVGK